MSSCSRWSSNLQKSNEDIFWVKEVLQDTVNEVEDQIIICRQQTLLKEKFLLDVCFLSYFDINEYVRHICWQMSKPKTPPPARLVLYF